MHPSPFPSSSHPPVLNPLSWSPSHLAVIHSVHCCSISEYRLEPDELVVKHQTYGLTVSDRSVHCGSFLSLFYPSKLLLISYLLEGGKVPNDKSQWECQRHIRKLVKSIASGILSTTSASTNPLNPNIKHGRPCKQRPSTVSTVLVNSKMVYSS